MVWGGLVGVEVVEEDIRIWPVLENWDTSDIPQALAEYKYPSERQRKTCPCQHLLLVLGSLKELGRLRENAVDYVLRDTMVLDVAEWTLASGQQRYVQELDLHETGVNEAVNYAFCGGLLVFF